MPCLSSIHYPLSHLRAPLLWYINAMKRNFIAAFFILALTAFPLFAEAEKERDSEELLEAADHGDVREVRELIKKGADVNALDEKEGVTPLIAATLGGHVEVVQVLIQAKADLNGRDNANGATALMWAATIRPDKEAIERGMVQPPVEKKLEIARLLIKAGAKVNLQNAWGGTSLQWAADEGNVEMVKLLLASGADPNLADQQGLMPLIAAAHYEEPNYLQILKMLLSSGAKLEGADASGKTPLMASTNNYGTATAEFLIKAGANVNAADKEGVTALMKACQMGRADVARLLIRSGARLDAKTKDGRSALKVAQDAGYKPTIQVLLDAGAKE